MSERRNGPRMALMVGVPLVLLGFAVWGVIAAWGMTGESEIGVHGYIAMALGAVFTIGLAAGLMWLAFYSHRGGYDDDVM